jgi:hypothetical protein
MTLTTMSALGLTKIEKTPKLLKMADQSVVIPVGILNNLETIIGGITFALDYYVIDPATSSSYQVLLGRPWLYTAKVHVNWNEKKSLLADLKFMSVGLLLNMKVRQTPQMKVIPLTNLVTKKRMH